jgi:peptidoglycan/LPS O-acetylase OafA/YrhL
LAAPGVFGLTVLTFSFEGGFVSKILKKRPFVFLGTLSYSIYMVHMLVQLGMRYALQLAESKSGIALFNDGRIGAEMWQGDIFYGVTMGLVVGVSYFTYKIIEEPGRRQSRRIADRIFATTESSTVMGSSAVMESSAVSQSDWSVPVGSCQDERNKSKR